MWRIAMVTVQRCGKKQLWWDIVRKKKRKRKAQQRNAPLCQNFRTAVITLLHPKQWKVTEILWHVKCQCIKYQDFNVTLFKKTGSINFQLHFRLVKSSRGNREKGASPWHRASHFEVWNKTLFSEAVECTCNRFNLTAAAVFYLSFVWFIFPLGVGAPERDGDALLTFPNLRISKRFTPVHSFSQPTMGEGAGLSLSSQSRWYSLRSDLPSPGITGGMSRFGPLQWLGEAGNSHFTCCYFKIISKIKAGYHRLGLSVKLMYVPNTYSYVASWRVGFTSALSYLYLILRVSIISLADLFLVTTAA